jgi:ethanolamine utilization protein EutQ (cupin superfamily)
MAMTYIKQAIKTEIPSMKRSGVNAFLTDMVISDDTEKTIVGGFFRMDKSDQPLVYEYTYHEMKIIVEGEMFISDQFGNQAHATVGDIFYFPIGTIVTFQSSSYGIGFFCGQRLEGEG